MRKSFALIIAAALSLCAAFPEEKYFVCISSFIFEQNADALVSRLSESGMQAFKSEATVDGRTFYRVLVGAGEDEIESARVFRESLRQNDILSDLNLKGPFWACKTESPYEDAVENTEPAQEEITLEGNDEIPTSEEKPYSLLINSYSEEQKAENDNERLHEQNIDSYVVKKYDEDELFKFDLHAGAFETPEETEELQTELSGMGIEGAEVANYNEFESLIDAYEERVQNQDVVTDTGVEKIPESLPESVQICLNQFPVNNDFDIKNIYILDFDAMRKHGSDYGLSGVFDSFLTMCGTTAVDVNAASFAAYRDDLYSKDINIMIFTSQNGAFKKVTSAIKPAETGEDLAKTEFELPYGILQCVMFQDGASHYTIGSTDDGNLMLVMEAEDFTHDEFLAFLNKTKADSTFLAYPQIRRTLFIMPDSLPENMEFIAYTLSKVDEDYVEEKDYADWAMAVEGHWSADCYYSLDGEDVTIGFFDLDYDYTASYVHSIFTDEKQSGIEKIRDLGLYSIDDILGHKKTINDANGWFLSNKNGDELSFAKKAYIVHVNSRSASTLTESDLTNIALMLQIWSGDGNTGIPSSGSPDTAVPDESSI